MAKIQHPSSLNPWQQYRQACSIFRNTSRASNPAWYQPALEQDLQLHIRVDGPDVFCTYYDRRKPAWLPGPELDEEILHDEERFQPILKSILGFTRFQGAKSLGIVLHIADEFATTELKPELDNPASLPDLRKTAIDNPGEILEDASMSQDEYSWRVIPYATGSEAIGTTITISRQFAPFLSELRKAGERANFPVITQTLSAPLVAIMGLDQMLPSQPTKPFVSILQYPWFTVMAFFNELADLKLIRTLQHRGARQANNFRNALFTTSASLEFLDPDLYIIPLGDDIDENLANTLKSNFPNCRIETLDAPQTDGLPPWCAEPIIASQAGEPQSAIRSSSLSSFRQDKWALQDFLPAPTEVLEIYPSKSEMGMLRGARLARVLIAVLAIAGLGYFGYGIFELTRLPQWSFETGQATNSKTALAQLNTEQKRIDHWNNLLADRSKAWIEMESLAQMFPPNSGILISDCSYSAKPDTTPGTGTIGFKKSWTISGFARYEAMDYLNSLNTREGMSKHFAKIASITGNEAYKPEAGKRDILVNVRTQVNRTYRDIPYDQMAFNDSTTYPNSFTLTITQRFEATDPMAITVPKAP